MFRESEHVSVCVCTFQRPLLVKRLLRALEGQDTGGQFTFSIRVVDNDFRQSARQCVEEFAAQSAISTTYLAEPQQNIALARNLLVQDADGSSVAFIDDDEFPVQDWLLHLLRARQQFQADGVLGPVRPHFEEPPPQWILRGHFWERPEYQTGRVMKWNEGRSGNLLVSKAVLQSSQPPFDPKFGNGGEDMDFLQRAAGQGAVFVWCNEAVVYETVPPERWKRSYLVKRALLRGKNILKHPGRAKLLAISAVAVLLYLPVLPFTLLLGQHWFMKYSVKLCDHLGRLLAFVGINPVSQR